MEPETIAYEEYYLGKWQIPLDKIWEVGQERQTILGMC